MENAKQDNTCWKKANLNDYIRVTLSEYGKQLLLRRVGKHAKDSAEQEADALYPGWREGRIETQIWCLLEILGADVHIGMGGPFDSNNVEIQIRDNPEEPWNPSPCSCI